MKKENWILCPVCRGKTRVKVREDTILKNFPLFCPKCKRETLIDIVNLKLNVLSEPDAAAARSFAARR